MFFFLRKDLYAAVFVGLLLGFPAAFALIEPSVQTLGFLLIAISSLCVCCDMCRTEDYGYVAGLANLARKYSTGFAQVTLIYLVPLFVLLHAMCTCIAIAGVVKGRRFTVEAWKWISEAPTLGPDVALAQ